MKFSQFLHDIPIPLLAWYDLHARILPWRETPTPYRVWISEIMLQQTRVETVKPYYQRFLEVLPDVPSLALASEELLLKLWEGLGYYSRVRNLQKAAKEVIVRYRGKLPASYEELLSLPGFGSYTAGAVASIAFGIPVPAVDGNVLRVFSRLTASEDDVGLAAVKASVTQLLQELIPPNRAGDFNQALMELGATVCLPNHAPKCEECPLSSLCEGRRLGIAESLPKKAPKKVRKIEEKTIVVLLCDQKVALQKRPSKGLLASLWEFPSMPGLASEKEAEAYCGQRGLIISSLEKLPAAKHIFTHIKWQMTGYLITVRQELSLFSWFDQNELQETAALPSAFRVYLAEAKKRL